VDSWLSKWGKDAQKRGLLLEAVDVVASPDYLVKEVVVESPGKVEEVVTLGKAVAVVHLAMVVYLERVEAEVHLAMMVCLEKVEVEVRLAMVVCLEKAAAMVHLD
jgi:hypothetical protein